VFASALTALVYKDRLLRTNDSLELPVRSIWVTSANNPTMSTEIARRSIRIRIDAKRDQPWLRPATDFTHPQLRPWVAENRAALVHAALTLIQAWVAKGMPAGTVTLGSYERYADIMGAILTVAGIDGFLGNLDQFYEAADLEGAVWREFTDRWWEQYTNAEVAVKDLFALALTVDGMHLGDGNNERSQRTVFGKQLGKQRDRVIGQRRIVFAGTTSGAVKRWRLIPTDGGTLFDPPPDNTAPTPEQAKSPVEAEPASLRASAQPPPVDVDDQRLQPVFPTIASDPPMPVDVGRRSAVDSARTRARMSVNAETSTNVYTPTDEANDSKGKRAVDVDDERLQADAIARRRAWCESVLQTDWGDAAGAPAWVRDGAVALDVDGTDDLPEREIARRILAALDGGE
jgi:hypothetical protein